MNINYYIIKIFIYIVNKDLVALHYFSLTLITCFGYAS